MDTNKLGQTISQKYKKVNVITGPKKNRNVLLLEHMCKYDEYIRQLSKIKSQFLIDN